MIIEKVKNLKNIVFFGNGTQMNYVIIKYLRKKTNYKPDLLLQDYNSIYDHPAWDDIDIKISQEIIMHNPDQAKNLLNQSIKESNWKMPSWIHENPIKYSLFDKFVTKYVNNYHTIKKQIYHYVNDLKNYDFVISDGVGCISSFLAKTPYAIRPYGTDLDILPFENNYVGKMLRKTYASSVAILGTHGMKSVSKLEGTEGKLQNISLIIDTEKFKPHSKLNKKNISFFYASRLDFETKRHDKAIRAFKKLLDSYDATLYFIEYGKDVQETHNLVKQLNIENNVKFYNFTASKSVLAQLYTEHDCIIGNLVLGNVGTTELEALACDVPVIAFSTISTNIEQDIPILNAFTEDEIYQKMIDVCEQKNLPTGKRQFIQKYFGLEYFLKHFNSILENKVQI